MPKFLYSILLFIVAMFTILVACFPKAQPVPGTPTTPALPQAAPIPLPPPTSLMPPEEATWAKVVETAKKEGQVTAYSFGWAGDASIAIGKAFKDRYGIRLETISSRPADAVERIKTEHRVGSMVADIYQGAPPYADILESADLLIPARDLPVLRDKGAFSIDPSQLSPKGYYLLENRIYVSLHVNTNLVKPGEEPKAWVDLLEPKWRGKIIFPDPDIGVAAYYLAVLVDQKRLTLDFLEKLGKQGLLIRNSGAEVAKDLARREGAIGYTLTTNSSIVAKEGAPIRIVDTREGVIDKGDSLALIKDAPHPNAALLLLNWSLSREGQEAIGKARGAVSVRKDVPDYSPPTIQLQPQNPVFVTAYHNKLIAELFRERKYVPLFKPK